MALPSSTSRPRATCPATCRRSASFRCLRRRRNWPSRKRWRDNEDMDAAHKLVTSHLRLVAKIAMGYRGYGLPVGELISEGNVGMMQAVKRFDPDRGFRLATYAMWWIRAAIQEYILHSWSLVKMGTTAAQKKLFFNLRRLKGQMQAIEDGDLQPEQVAKIATRAGRAGAGRGQHEPPPGGARSQPERTRSRGQRGRVAGLAGRRGREPGTRLADREELTGRQGAAGRCAEDAERARAPHPDRAAAEGQPDDAGGVVAAIQHLPRAGAPDRGAGVREAAEVDEEPGRRAPPGQHPSRRRGLTCPRTPLPRSRR